MTFPLYTIGFTQKTAEGFFALLKTNGVKVLVDIRLKPDSQLSGFAKGRDLHPMQAAFHNHHALQCGYCTAGIVMNAIDLVKRHPNPSEETVRAGLEGNFCRCTGYHNIVKAVLAGAAAMK